MKRIFITYGDTNYEAAKARLVSEACQTGEFDAVLAYGREDLSGELLASDIIKEQRGGGLWSWKPDVLFTTMKRYSVGDIIVYCDAGCSLYPSKEWKHIWKKLEQYDIIAQRIYQRTDRWTRKEIIDYFVDNGQAWLSMYQFQATVILIVSDFTLQLVGEWRDLMLNHPLLAMDVTDEERKCQLPQFIENRHDQAIYSALIYKYLRHPETRHLIYTQWEHIEDFDPFCPQAIRATRLRRGETETPDHRRKAIIKRLVKDYILKPLYYAPLQWWHVKKTYTI